MAGGLGYVLRSVSSVCIVWMRLRKYTFMWLLTSIKPRKFFSAPVLLSFPLLVYWLFDYSTGQAVNSVPSLRKRANGTCRNWRVTLLSGLLWTMSAAANRSWWGFLTSTYILIACQHENIYFRFFSVFDQAASPFYRMHRHTQNSHIN